MTRRVWVRGKALQTVIDLKGMHAGDEVELDLSNTVHNVDEKDHHPKRILEPCDREDHVDFSGWMGFKFICPCLGIVRLNNNTDLRHITAEVLVAWRPKKKGA